MRTDTDKNRITLNKARQIRNIVVLLATIFLKERLGDSKKAPIRGVGLS